MVVGMVAGGAGDGVVPAAASQVAIRPALSSTQRPSSVSTCTISTANTIVDIKNAVATNPPMTASLFIAIYIMQFLVIFSVYNAL